jgi:nicotinate-nucleotide pyrophosphorylase (carboxylating)
MADIRLEPIVRAALLEDLGRAGDLTSDAIVPPDATLAAALRARKPGCLCGVEIAALAFRMLDPEVAVEVALEDGADLAAGDTIATIRGNARAILSAERTALNLLCRLSGIATATQRLVRACAGHRARIIDTRKTTPGLRVLEKYAVRAGGDDAVLIKDNHVAFAGGITPAVEAVRRSVGHLVKIEVEVDTIEQLIEALEIGVEVILLDNFTPDQMREAVTLARGRAILEASGRVTEDNVAQIAATGVDLISSGWITHSSPALDIGLDFET